MIRKYCPRCKSYSYSASSLNPWICSDCGGDLSYKPILEIDEVDTEDLYDDGSSTNSHAVGILESCK